MINLSPKQEEAVETIFKLTKEFCYPPTLDEIAAKMGITKGTLQYHMSALRKKRAIEWNTGAARSVRIVDADRLQTMEHQYTEQFGKLNKDSVAENKPYPVKQEFTSIMERTRIPVLGKIAAGSPLTLMDETEDYLELDSYFADGCYALRVKGESMIDACIADGDLILVEPKDNYSPRAGEMVVALVNDEAATVKRFFKEDDGRIRLQPENSTMDPIILDFTDTLNVQGIVKGVVRKL